MRQTVSQIKSFLRIDYQESDRVYFLAFHSKDVIPSKSVEIVLSESEFKQMVKDCCVHLLSLKDR